MLYVRFISPIFTAARTSPLARTKMLPWQVRRLPHTCSTQARIFGCRVSRLFLPVQAAPAGPLTVDSTLVATLAELFFSRLGPVGRVCSDGAIAVLIIEQIIRDLAVVNTGVGHRIVPDQLVFLVDVEGVFRKVPLTD